MKPIKIERLDQLESGMKTLDGKITFRYFRKSDSGDHYAIFRHLGTMTIPYFPDEENAKQIFLNQEVEVPE